LFVCFFGGWGAILIMILAYSQEFLPRQRWVAKG